MAIRAALAGLIDLVAPRRCPGCDHPLDWGELGFCGACAPLIERLRHGPAAYAYGGPLGEGLRRLKYEGRTDLLEALHALVMPLANAHAGRVDAVVPVPLHPERLRDRGFNQAALLAEPLAKALGVPLAEGRLVRVRGSVPQASLKEAERAANVHRAFEGRRDPERPRLLLFDDVRTTGATLRSASGALYRAGASTVRVQALAGVP